MQLLVYLAATKTRLTLLFLAGSLISSRHVHYAVRVDIERYFYLRHASRRGWYTDEAELSQKFVVACHFSLALMNLDLDLSLTVRRRREHLALLRRYGRVARD